MEIRFYLILVAWVCTYSPRMPRGGYREIMSGLPFLIIKGNILVPIPKN